MACLIGPTMAYSTLICIGMGWFEPGLGLVLHSRARPAPTSPDLHRLGHPDANPVQSGVR